MVVVKQVKPVMISEKDFASVADCTVKTIEYKCHYCNNSNRFVEAYLTEFQKEMVDMLIKQLIDMVEEVDKAAIEVYGENPARVLFVKKIQEIKDRFMKPKLSLVKYHREG